MKHVMRRGVSLVVVSVVAGAMLPTGALASLPDNRIYEQVSPENKDGNVLVGVGKEYAQHGALLASEDGNDVLYESSGAIGNDSNQGGIQEDLSRRVPGVGWTTEPADPRQLGRVGFGRSLEAPSFYAGSADFFPVYFDALGCCELGSLTANYPAYSPEEPANGADLKLYESENPLVPPRWIGKPMIEKPIPALGETEPGWSVAGVSPDGSTLYFNAGGTLLPEDEIWAGHGNSEVYELSNGELAEAGTLPDGKLSPYGAATAGVSAYGNRFHQYSGHAEEGNGQVSEDGRRVFFVSPNPGAGAPASEPSELYMREALANGGHRTVLISRDTLLPNVKETNSKGREEEFPAPAPGGVSTFNTASGPYTGGSTMVYASPDGSHVFFASADVEPLTSAASSHSEWQVWLTYYCGGNFSLEVTANSSTQKTGPLAYGSSLATVQAALEGLSNVGAGKVMVSGGEEGGPPEYVVKFPSTKATMQLDTGELTGDVEETYIRAITLPNIYEYDVATEKLIYLPELTGAGLAASSADGSRVMFLSASGDLDLLSGGTEEPKVETIVAKLGGSVTPARAAGDGSAFLFYASSASGGPLSSFNNGGYAQFYRYDVASKELACVSCPPPAIKATGPAETNFDSELISVQPVRMMSEDGTRVFFGSPDPLVEGDINGMPDVYEWENGDVYLISSGNALVPSSYVDSSKTGGDVFFETAQGLIPSDEDEQVDVYDARIPRLGDNPPPPKQTPCSGAVCQGPPSVPHLLSPASSATFEGLGNIPPESEKKEEVTKPPVAKCKKGYVKKNRKCVKKKKPRKGKPRKGKTSAKGHRSGK